MLACRVLLADDTPEIRQLLRMVLELEDGFEVVGEAADGREALDIADDKRPDAVVLDLAMPVMDGLQAIPAIREAAPATKILVLSGFTERQMAREALAVGADAYLEKGVAPQEIVAALRELCSLSSNGAREPTKLPVAVDRVKAEDPIGALAHDLLTPVAVIRGFAEAIVHRARDIRNGEIEEWAEKIVRNSESLVDIVRSLRGSTDLRNENVELDLGRFDAATLVRETMDDLGPLLEDREVNLSLVEDTFAYADEVKIRQIVTNLISNAVRFTTGAIDIEMARGIFHVEIAVCDRGPGIPEKLRSGLFERGDRSGAEEPGPGGLYVSRQLARAQGADVVYRDRDGGGACFGLRIPLTD